MPINYPGGIVSATERTTSSNSASGVWSLPAHMQKQKAGIWPAISSYAPDPYFEYNSLLIHADASNGANNTVMVDSSTNAFTITNTGKPYQGTFSPFSHTGWSNYFDGTGDYLTAGSSVSLSGDFTVECWVYGVSYGSNGFYLYGLGNDLNSTAATFFITTAGYLRVFTGNANILSGTSATFSLNTWNHVAFVRSSNTLKAYLNGVQVDSASWSNAISGLSHINAELNGVGTQHIQVAHVIFLIFA
jgi:hypothetical protein